MTAHAELPGDLGGVRARERSDRAPRPRSLMANERAAHADRLCPQWGHREASRNVPARIASTLMLLAFAMRMSASPLSERVPPTSFMTAPRVKPISSATTPHAP